MSELSDKVDRLAETAARTDTNVSWIRNQMGAQMNDHEERLRKVERRQWWIAGVFTTIGALLGFGGTHGLKP